MPVTSSISNSNSSTAVPKAFLVAAMCVVCVESILFLQNQRTAQSTNAVPFYPRHSVPTVGDSVIHWQLSNGEPAEIVFIGDSSCLMGVQPNVVSEITNRSTRNMGTIAMLHSEGHADGLEKYIEKHGPPKAVVYHMTTVFGTGYYGKEAIRKMGRLTRYRAWSGIQPEALIYNVPSIRKYRHSLQDRTRMLFATAGNQEAYLRAQRGLYPSHEEMGDQLTRSKGWMPEVEMLDWDQFPDHMPRELHMNSDMYPGLKRVMALAFEHDIKIGFVQNPIPEKFKVVNPAGEQQKFESTIKGMADNEQSIHFYPEFIRPYPLKWCAQIQHLNEEGSRHNSREIAEWLNESVL